MATVRGGDFYQQVGLKAEESDFSAFAVRRHDEPTNSGSFAISRTRGKQKRFGFQQRICHAWLAIERRRYAHSIRPTAAVRQLWS